MPIFRGAIFDVDGVLINSPHEEAWRQSLQELMGSDWADIRDRTTWSPAAFTSHVYQEEVSGEPRINGARAALGYFHVPDADRRAEEYAERKQAALERLIQSGDFGAFPDALRFVIALKDLGFRIAAASSSKNAEYVPAQDPPRHICPGARHRLGIGPAGPHPAGRLRRRCLGPRFRARQAVPRHVPRRRPRARGRTDAGRSHRGRGRPASKPQRRRPWPRSGSRAPTTRRCWRRPAQTSWSLPSTRLTAARSPRAD